MMGFITPPRCGSDVIFGCRELRLGMRGGIRRYTHRRHEDRPTILPASEFESVPLDQAGDLVADSNAGGSFIRNQCVTLVVLGGLDRVSSLSAKKTAQLHRAVSLTGRGDNQHTSPMRTVKPRD
jgi:hypothetical protein